MVKSARWTIEAATHEEILRLLRQGVGIRTIANRLGVGIRTVQRRSDLLRKESLEPGAIDFRPVAVRRCEVHGLVKFWPCVVCAALKAAQENN